MSNSQTITLRVQDVSGQREIEMPEVRTDSSWAEVMRSALNALPHNTPAGNDTTWSARLDREGRSLHYGSEIVGDALVDGDRVVLQPEIAAGRECRRSAPRN